MPSARIVLREFAYFDRQKVEDFLSGIEDGLMKEVAEVRGKVAAGIGGKLGIPSVAKLSAKLERGENKQQELKTATDASLFQRLYTHLTDSGLVRKLRTIDQNVWASIQNKEILELEGRIEPSPVQILFETMGSIMSMPKSPEPSGKQPQLNIEELYKLMLSSRESANIRVILENAEYCFIASLSRSKMRVSLHEMGAEFSVLCRIQRKLRKNETFDLFSLVPGMKLPRDTMDNFAATAPNFETLLGRRIDLGDFVVTYPSILVTPIAIYR